MSTPFTATALVPMGHIVITPAAQETLSPRDIIHGLGRHSRGDWGELEEEDISANDQSLKSGSRLLSAYHGEAGARFWIITEADRSITTLLLPDEY
jgi:hypothetical protein